MQDSTQNQSSQGISASGTTDTNIDSGFPESVPQASPSDFFPPPPPTSSSMQKNKIIATFLGMLLLVGGLGMGIVLVGQPQLFRQSASEIKPTPIPNCVSQEQCSDTNLLGSNACIKEGGEVSYCCPQNYKIFEEEERCILK